MNKLNSQLQTPTFAVDGSFEPDHRTHHLIVLLPADADYTAATRKVWELASTLGAGVQLLSLCSDAAQESSIRRRLVTTASLLEDSNVSVEWKIESGSNWVRAVKRNYQAGDTIACFADQRAGLLHRPLSQILESDLKAPIYILSDPPSQSIPQSNWLSQFIIWVGSLGIITGSFLLQIRITSLAQDWAQTTLMILSLLGEIWLIWVWNSLFN